MKHAAAQIMQGAAVLAVWIAIVFVVYLMW